ncbi:MAG TPA: amidohydrolase [Acidimicrobiales bacterium]|nr:amidohydrolase [Acidimicrobiales bacterium]
MAKWNRNGENLAMWVDALYRGRFVTFDPERPSCSLLAVSGGRVVAAEEDAEGLEARVREDFGAASIWPGFHDAHCHTAAFGLGLTELNLSTPPISTMNDLYDAVAEAALALGPNDWVIGSGYDQNKLGGTHPSRRRLDEAAGGRPVWLKHTSGHMCFANSAVLAMIGPKLAAPIDGGRLQFGVGGQPTGLFEERAQALVQELRPARSLDQLAEAIDRAHRVYLSEGLTSVCEAGVAGGWVGQSPLELGAYQLARDTARLGVRTTAMISAAVLHDVGARPSDALAAALDAGIRTGLGDEWLRIGALKVFSDGSLIGRTCWMHDGFEDDPGNTGYPQADPAEMKETIIGAHCAGWQVSTHAIGDAAVDFALECYSAALQAQSRPDHRHRIEHCGVASDAAVTSMAAMGVIPVPQGRFIGEIGDGMAAALGQARVPQTYRLRSFIDAGLGLPASSDRPVVDGRPLLGIRDMVCRLTQSGEPFGTAEALSPTEALFAYTVGSAYASRCDDERGRLTPGMLADFVVLADDPRSVPPADLGAIPIVATVLGGEVVFRSADAWAARPRSI